MKCKKSTGDCKLELKFYENGDILEFCAICNFNYFHEIKNIKNSELNINYKEN
jgi:hypothetical protein